MAKTLLYRLLGIGKVPEPWASALKQEGLLLLDEGISGSVSYHNFRSPGMSAVGRRQWYTASIALSGVRLVALRSGTPLINVPYTDGRFQRMSFSLEGNDTLVIAFDAALFHDDWSGSIEFRFRTPQAASYLKMLNERKGGETVTLESVPPVVVSTVPEAGACEVDPLLTDIQVRFSKDMQDGAFSFTTHSTDSFPEMDGKPKYLADRRTCVLPVKLEPGKTYALWVNSQNFRNFKDAEDRSAVPYLLVFRTRK